MADQQEPIGERSICRKFIPVAESFARWSKDPKNAEAYEATEKEFAFASAIIRARGDADMTREQGAEAIGTPQAPGNFRA
jgi:hypothetical protein